jgi:hypothetical protein
MLCRSLFVFLPFFLMAIVLSVLRFIASDYSFGNFTKKNHSTCLHFLYQKESLIYKLLLMRKHFIQTSQKEYISRHAHVVCLVKPSRLTFRYWRIYFDILQEICQMGYFSKDLPWMNFILFCDLLICETNRNQNVHI